MNKNSLSAAVVMFAAASSAYAQQTEFVAPDAGFSSSITRVEVRQDLERAASIVAIAHRHHSPQDSVNAAGTRSGQDVHREAKEAARTQRSGDWYSPRW